MREFIHEKDLKYDSNANQETYCLEQQAIREIRKNIHVRLEHNSC